MVFNYHLIYCSCFIYFWRAVRHKINQVHASLGMAILLVRLPREVGQPDAAAKQDKPASQQIQEQISVAEILLSG